MTLYIELPMAIEATQFNEWADDEDVVIAFRDNNGILYPDPRIIHGLDFAVKYTKTFALQDSSGFLQEVNIGDYIVVNNDTGKKYVMPKEKFERSFKRVT